MQLKEVEANWVSAARYDKVRVDAGTRHRVERVIWWTMKYADGIEPNMLPEALLDHNAAVCT